MCYVASFRKFSSIFSINFKFQLGILGYMKEEILDIRKLGLEKHIQNSMWNIMELVKNCIYMLVIILRLYAYIHEQIEIQHNPNIACIPREEWNMFDPQLIAEGWFATANILRLVFDKINTCL